MSRRLRVAFHAHSTWSYDGHWGLGRIARTFGRLGFDAVMMTEHDTGFAADRFEEYRLACDSASTRRCRLIAGIEYSDPKNDIHILAWGSDRFLGEGRPVATTLQEVRAAGGVAMFAHPVRRDAWRLFDDAWTPLLDGIEIWNRKADGVAPGEEALRLQARTGLRPLAGLDFHRPRQLYPLDNLVELDAADPHGSMDDLECRLVSAIHRGAWVPRAFRCPLVDAAGRPRAGALGVHRRLEVARRRIRDIVTSRPMSSR